MNIKASFLKSCAALTDLPAGDVPEAALLGRSNVGKSSLLNALIGQELARTSRTPGRTRLLNYFSLNDAALYLVDCPGYGYARASRSLREAWGAVTQAYLEHSTNLRLTLLLVDATLPAQAIDLAAAEWLRARGRDFTVVATKCDRLSGNQRPVAERGLAGAFATTPLLTSAVTAVGCDPLRRLLLDSGHD